MSHIDVSTMVIVIAGASAPVIGSVTVTVPARSNPTFIVILAIVTVLTAGVVAVADAGAVAASVERILHLYCSGLKKCQNFGPMFLI